MPIPITIELTANVKNLKIYDHFGSDKTLEGHGHDYLFGTSFNFYTSNLPKCCDGPAQGSIEIIGEIETPSGVWVEKDSIVLVVGGGVYQWP